MLLIFFISFEKIITFPFQFTKMQKHDKKRKNVLQNFYITYGSFSLHSIQMHRKCLQFLRLTFFFAVEFSSKQLYKCLTVALLSF